MDDARAQQRLTRRRVLANGVALGALMVAGCRAGVGPSSPPLTDLTVLAPAHPLPTVQRTIAEQATAAAREIGARLSLQVLPLDVLRSRLPNLVAAGQPPDLALVGDADPAVLSARGWLRDLREPLDRIVGLNGDLFPPLRAVAASGSFEDRPADQPSPIRAIPYLTIGGAWLLRQDLLSRDGLPPPRTFDDVRAIATKLTDLSANRFGWAAGLPLDDAIDDLARVALLAYGAPTFDPLGLRVELAPDLAAAGLQAVARLYRSDDGSPLAPNGSVDWTDVETLAAFAQGKVVQTLDRGGLYARLVSDEPGWRQSILALPPPAGPKGWFTSAPTRYFVAPRSGTPAGQAVSFLERLLRPERYEALARAGQGSVIPPYSYLTKRPFWDEDPNDAAYFHTARGDPARGFQFAPPGFPSPPTLPAAVVEASHVFARTLRSVVGGEASTTDAAAALKRQCEKLVAEALALQPAPSPTPAPFWVRWLGPTSTPSRTVP